MKYKTLYLLSPKIKFKTFQLLQDKLVKDSGPTPINLDKILWELLKEKKVYCGFTSGMKDDMWIGFDIPPHEKLEIISTP